MVPDWRFMQLVCNLQAQIGGDGFYLEEDKAMELIEQMLKGEQGVCLKRYKIKGGFENEILRHL